jgi:outer membrane lipoprotein-sorting protein
MALPWSSRTSSAHGALAVNIFRRLPLSRLLLLCGLVVVLGISATALASALGTGPTPPPKPLASAIHDALTAPPVEGVSANIQLTDHLLEGANLASGGENGGAGNGLTSSPLVTGGSGRMWIAKDGHVRLELQAEKGDTQVLYDGHTVSIYDAASNTLYRYTVPARDGTVGETTKTDTSPDGSSQSTLVVKPDETQAAVQHEIPTVAKIEEAISHLDHVNVSGATPSDIAGQAAYTVHVSPKESGSLIGGGELSWDAVNGVPLRAAIYSSTSSSPALELAASSISYGPVDGSVFEFTPPANAKVQEILPPKQTDPAEHGGDRPQVTTHGQGITSVGVIEAKSKSGAGQPSSTSEEGLQKVKINGIEASELSTQLGTLLSFERSGVRYLLVGAVSPGSVEAVAKGL